MLKSQVLNSAILKDARSDTPFIIYRLPGSRDVVCHTADVEFDGCRLTAPGIELTTWLGRSYSGMKVCAESTTLADYTAAIDSIVDHLKTEGGKTVLSRTICGKFKEFDPTAMISEYFAMFPDMFCFCACHPHTGFWMGASPELLLVRKADGSADTRALAGTRPADTPGAWDFKNIEEHRMVIDDICRRATSLNGYSATAGETGILRYGAVEHLATPITVNAPGGIDMRKVIAAIHPTAAIAGLPLERAIGAIEATEKEARKFYGGTIIAGDTAYVALRCVHFDSSRWCIYTGSGITAHSSAADEWTETAEKARPLQSLLQHY